MVIWLIGLSGSGKTTVGTALREKILEDGASCVLIDGDIIREIFANDLGHSLADRKKNADRICKLCAYLDSQGVNVVCAILSIFHDSQDWNRKNISDYYEVFLDAELEAVMERDVKGVYARAKVGKTENVVGVDIEFPQPKSPNLVLKNDFLKEPSVIAQEIFDQICSSLK